MKLSWAPQTRGIRGIVRNQFNWLRDAWNIGACADRCGARDAHQRALSAAGE